MTWNIGTIKMKVYIVIDPDCFVQEVFQEKSDAEALVEEMRTDHYEQYGDAINSVYYVEREVKE